MFSTLGTIKVDKRSRLKNQSLDDLLLLKSDKIPLASFNPDQSIDLWWSAKARRPSQKERKEYRQRSCDCLSTSNLQDSETETEPEDMLECWDKMMNTDSDSD